jgi:hypothetical protein
VREGWSSGVVDWWIIRGTTKTKLLFSAVSHERTSPPVGIMRVSEVAIER